MRTLDGIAQISSRISVDLLSPSFIQHQVWCLEGHKLVRRSWDYRYAFHLSVYPVFCDLITYSPLLPCLRLRRRGVECLNLCQLNFVRLVRNLVSQSHLNMALVKARSVCNKTFLLKYFFYRSQIGYSFFDRDTGQCW